MVAGLYLSRPPCFLTPDDAPAKPCRSVWRLVRRCRARVADGQSRRAVSHRRAESSAHPPLGVAAVDLLSFSIFTDAIATSGATATAELFFLDEVTGLARRSPSLLRMPAKGSGAVCRAIFRQAETRIRASDGQGAARRTSRRQSQTNAPAQGRRAARRRDDNARRQPLRRAGKAFVALDAAGYGEARPRRLGTHVDVLTPPSILAVLERGYRPLWHPSAD